ncbi:UDP-glucose/GDP-mannose dehydrogenase family protein [bacterium]|nr:UDP-glucose/GDP-mannose dehydrogenase family protein [bacterium]MBU1615414.1 UDP-glucose/GDP-mannose dehydrogenase family protein [bacterium]
MRRIAVIGSGYVGLVTGACLAELGNKVICVDHNEEKIESLKKGIMPIYEPGLDEVVDRNVKAKRLFFISDTKEAVETSQIIFIAVHTPPLPNGEADMRFVEAVSSDVAKFMKDYKLVISKSTVPIKTGEWIKRTIGLANKANIDFDVASNPEFLREGSAISDFMNPDRVVIGVESERAKEILTELYAPLNAPIVVTNIESSELIKHASNSFLAMKISYINALANICEITGADVIQVAEGMGLDKRIGRDFLDAGIGYGGSCFPKDISAFITIAGEAGYDFELLKAVEKINKWQRLTVVKKLKEFIWVLNNKTIGVLGLSFKPNTDDLRQAPSIDIINILEKEGARIKAYDPVAMEKAKEILPNVIYSQDPYEVARESDALLFLTEWEEFRELDLKKIKSLLSKPIIIDGRNIFDPCQMKELGFYYKGVGR